MHIKEIVRNLETASRIPDPNDSWSFMRDTYKEMVWQLAEVVRSQAERIDALENKLRNV